MEGSKSQLSSVRFGSLDYIQETLPSSQAARLKSLVGGLKDSSVVSVLVKSPAEDLPSSSAENSILLRCLKSLPIPDLQSAASSMVPLLISSRAKNIPGGLSDEKSFVRVAKLDRAVFQHLA